MGVESVASVLDGVSAAESDEEMEAIVEGLTFDLADIELLARAFILAVADREHRRVLLCVAEGQQGKGK